MTNLLDGPREQKQGEDLERENARLRRELAGLEKELQETKDEAAKVTQASKDAVSAVRALRKVLEPFWTALRMINGEISRVDVEQFASAVGAAAPTGTGGLSPKLQMIKRQLGGRQEEFIDLLAHGAMTTAQLAAAAHCHRDTVAQVIHKLTKAGLITKVGNEFALKES